MVAACHVLATRDLAGEHAPPALADAAPPLGNGFGLVVRALTDALPAYPGVPAEQSAQGLQLLCTDRADLAAAHGDWAAGRLPRTPVPLAMSFSASDDTLAPPGRHVVTIWGQWYPYALADGADWDALAESEGRRLVDAVDRYAPGFADSVQRLYVQTPLQLERELSLPRGNVMHVEMGLASMFGFRPTPALAGYTVPGLAGPLPRRRLHPPRRRGVGQLRPDGGPRPARRPASARPGPGRGAPRRQEAASVTAAVLVRGAAPAVRQRALPMALAVLLVLTAIAYPLTSGAGRDAVSWTIVVLGACLSVLHAGLSRGARVGAGVALLVTTTAVAVEAVGLATGFPYGRYEYGDALGPTAARRAVPRPPGLADDGLAELGARRPADAPGDGGRRAVVRVGVAAAVFAGWDVVLDPQMVQAGYWTWTHPEPGLPGIPTVPLTNLAGWLAAGVVLMTLLSLLVSRTSVADAPRIGDAAPLLALAWMTLGGALAHAGWLGLPGSAAWGAGLAVPVLIALLVQQRATR